MACQRVCRSFHIVAKATQESPPASVVWPAPDNTATNAITKHFWSTGDFCRQHEILISVFDQFNDVARSVLLGRFKGKGIKSIKRAINFCISTNWWSCAKCCYSSQSNWCQYSWMKHLNRHSPETVNVLEIVKAIIEKLRNQYRHVNAIRIRPETAAVDII